MGHWCVNDNNSNSLTDCSEVNVDYSNDRENSGGNYENDCVEFSGQQETAHSHAVKTKIIKTMNQTDNKKTYNCGVSEWLQYVQVYSMTLLCSRLV